MALDVSFFSLWPLAGSHRHLDFLAVLDGARGQADIADFLSPILGYTTFTVPLGIDSV